MDLIIILLVILAVVVIWRGPKTLPKWGEALGQAVRGVRREVDKVQSGDDDSSPTDPSAQPRT